MGYALEILEPEEREDYGAHLLRCTFCRQLVGQHQSVTELLPDILLEETASPGLKERILSGARGEAEGAVGPNQDARHGRWPRWTDSRPVWAAAAMAVVVAGLVAWNITLQLGPDGEGPTQTDLIQAIASGAAVIHLQGTEIAPGSSGALVQSPEDSVALLLVQNLARLPSDQEYQVWRIEADIPVSAGTFVPTGAEAQLVRLDVDFSSADAIGVSRERKGGNSAPTPGAIVLLGIR